MFMPWSASERQTFPSDPERLSMRMVNSLVMGMPGTSLRAVNGRRDESPSCRMAMMLDVVGDRILRLGHGGCKGRSNGTLSKGRRKAELWAGSKFRFAAPFREGAVRPTLASA